MNRSLSGDELCCLVYISTAVADLDANDLAKILSSSQLKNSASAVTGLLLYSGDHFIQVLEGSADAVAEIFVDRISEDPRHSKIVTLVHEKIERRSFDSWSMALKNIEPEKLTDIPGFADYEEVSGPVPAASPIGKRVRKLLDTFRLAA